MRSTPCEPSIPTTRSSGMSECSMSRRTTKTTMLPRTRWQSPSRPHRAAALSRTTRSLSTSSTRKAPRSSTSRAAADPRSSSSAASRSFYRRSFWTPARSCSMQPIRRQDRDQQDRAQPVQRCRRQDQHQPRPGRGRPARQPTWGQRIPTWSSILETANRQKNLPGELVVDAVPSANSKYLEAVLGKDITAKRDAAVKRTSAESSRPGFFGFFGLFGRRSDPPVKKSTTGSTAMLASAPDDDAKAADPRAGGQTSTNTKAGSSSDNVAKKGDGVAGTPTAKKDDAVQKAKAEESEPPRRRFFDFLRPRDES